MKVRIMEGGYAPFFLFMRRSPDGYLGSLTINLHEVQAISRMDVKTATVGVLISGCWVYGQLTERPYSSFSSEDEYMRHVNKQYDKLGSAWAEAKQPLFIGDPNG